MLNHACLLRAEVLPENITEAIDYCITKLIKGMGEAKTLAVRLSTVKHQESLRTLVGSTMPAERLHAQAHPL